MALHIDAGAPTLVIRRPAYERSGLTRAVLDERLNLTPDEFRVEGNLVVIGPIYAEQADLGPFIADLEALGLEYYEDFFELSGNWPNWLGLHASAAQ